MLTCHPMFSPSFVPSLSLVRHSQNQSTREIRGVFLAKLIRCRKESRRLCYLIITQILFEVYVSSLMWRYDMTDSRLAIHRATYTCASAHMYVPRDRPSTQRRLTISLRGNWTLPFLFVVIERIMRRINLGEVLHYATWWNFYFILFFSFYVFTFSAWFRLEKQNDSFTGRAMIRVIVSTKNYWGNHIYCEYRYSWDTRYKPCKRYIRIVRWGRRDLFSDNHGW